MQQVGCRTTNNEEASQVAAAVVEFPWCLCGLVYRGIDALLGDPLDSSTPLTCGCAIMRLCWLNLEGLG